MEHFTQSAKSIYRTRIRPAITKKRLIIAGCLLLAFLILTPVLTYVYFARDISDRERLMNRSDTGIILKDASGKVFYQTGEINTDDNVPLSQISDTMEHALIASEDHDFYHHDGFSIKGIIGAMYGDVVNADPTKYGGSTLTQQLVKNKLLSSNKSFLRKYQEISMAVAVERRYTKDQILDMYLNSVYFGDGAFGIKDAAKAYFNETPAQLDLAQSATLVGLLPAPSAYSPLNGSDTLAKQQQALVLRKMVQNHYINTAQVASAKAEQLKYVSGTTDTTNTHGQHFAQMVLEQLYAKYGEEKVKRSGFEVTTTLNLNWQQQAERIIKQRVAIMARHGGRNASLVAIDPKTGDVRALVGSVDWNNPQFGQVNMATTPRQPGSSFKPIYYTEALDKHLITASSILEDKRTTFGGSYTPKNVDGTYKGAMTVRNALAQSRNIPAVEVLQKLGIRNSVNTAQRMGLSTVNQPDKYGLSLALGTAEVRLTQMVDAYAAFANGGVQHKPVMISSIQNKYGERVYKAPSPSAKRVQSATASYILTSILSDNAARAPLYGSALNLPSGRPAAVKTGTTNDNVDAWTLGYTPDLAIGVWVGNNEHQPMVGLAGGSAAGVIWRQAMVDFIGKTPIDRFKMPSGITKLLVCRSSGLRATYASSSTYNEYFINGTEPTGTCNTTRSVPKTHGNSNNSNAGKGKQPKETTPAPTPTPDTTTPTPTDPTTPPTGGQGGGDGTGTGDGSGTGTGGGTTDPGTGGGPTTP